LSSPYASVVIATRDRPGPLAETLGRIVAQELAGRHYEIVVVDDGTSPPLVMDERRATGPELRSLRLAGEGRSAARNAGAVAARGEILVFLDDDMSVAPDFVAAHLRAHEEWPGALIVGGIRLPETALATPFGRFRQRLEDTGMPAARGLVSAPNVCAAGNMSLPRAAFEALGGFEPTLASGEDQDLALRHVAHGGRIGFLPEARAVHRDQALDIRSYCRRVEGGSADVVAFCRRHPDLPDNRERARVNGPLHWGREPVRLSARKIAKAALATPPGRAALFGLAAAFESVAPGSRSLDRLYRLLLGVFVFRGFRRGLREARGA